MTSIQCQSHTIDDYSQRMLLAFDSADDVLTTGDFIEAAGFEDNGRQKVKYRLETHLIPANLIEEEERLDEEGPDTARRWSLTDKGAKFLIEYDLEPEIITVEEAFERASEALDAVDSAETSIHNLQVKVNRWTEKVEDYRKTTAEVDEQMSLVRANIDELDERTTDLKNHQKEMVDQWSNELEKVRDSIEELQADLEAIADRIDSQEEQITDQGERLNNQEKQLTDQERRLSNQEEQMQQLEERLEREEESLL